MQRLEIVQDYDLPAERVFAHLAEHENLGPLFGAEVERLEDGTDSRNGVGSVRRISAGPIRLAEETVTAFEPDRLIGYRITAGSPLRDHRGTVRVTPTPGGSRVEWVVEFGAAVPLLDKVVALGLERSLRKGLRGLPARA